MMDMHGMMGGMGLIGILLILGLWLIAAPWLLLDSPGPSAAWNDVICGLLIVGLSLPRGRRSAEHYRTWERYAV